MTDRQYMLYTIILFFMLGMCFGVACGTELTEKREARKRNLHDCMSAGHHKGWCEAYLDGYFEDSGVSVGYSKP